MLCGEVVNSAVSALSWSKLTDFLFVGEVMPALQGSVKGTDPRAVSFPFLRSLVGRLGGWPKGCMLYSLMGVENSPWNQGSSSLSYDSDDPTLTLGSTSSLNGTWAPITLTFVEKVEKIRHCGTRPLVCILRRLEEDIFLCPWKTFPPDG